MAVTIYIYIYIHICIYIYIYITLAIPVVASGLCHHDGGRWTGNKQKADHQQPEPYVNIVWCHIHHFVWLAYTVANRQIVRQIRWSVTRCFLCHWRFRSLIPIAFYECVYFLCNPIMLQCCDAALSVYSHDPIQGPLPQRYVLTLMRKHFFDRLTSIKILIKVIVK